MALHNDPAQLFVPEGSYNDRWLSMMAGGLLRLTALKEALHGSFGCNWYGRIMMSLCKFVPSGEGASVLIHPTQRHSQYGRQAKGMHDPQRQS